MRRAERVTVSRNLNAASSYRCRYVINAASACGIAVGLAEISMSDPVTIGVLTASALAMAGEALVKGAVGEAVKEAYKAVRDKVALWIHGDVEALEKDPTSASRQAVVADEIDKRLKQLPKDEAKIIKGLVSTLSAALNDAAKTNAVGLDVRRLESQLVQLKQVNVTEGTGASFDEMKTDKFIVDEVSVGKRRR